LSVAASSRTWLSSCSSSPTRSYIVVAFLHWSALPCARLTSDYFAKHKTGHQQTSTTQVVYPTQRRLFTVRACPECQDRLADLLHVLIILKDISLPRSIIPVNVLPPQTWFRRRRTRCRPEPGPQLGPELMCWAPR
jgi:hypothetical protein